MINMITNHKTQFNCRECDEEVHVMRTEWSLKFQGDTPEGRTNGAGC